MMISDSIVLPLRPPLGPVVIRGIKPGRRCGAGVGAGKGARGPWPVIIAMPARAAACERKAKVGGAGEARCVPIACPTAGVPGRGPGGGANEAPARRHDSTRADGCRGVRQAE